MSCHLTLNAMAAELGVTTHRLREWAMDGRIPYDHSENGKRLFFDRDAVWSRVFEMTAYGPKGQSFVRLTSAKETAKKLGLRPEELRRRTVAGDLPCFVAGNRFIYNLDFVMALDFVKELERSKKAKNNTWRRQFGLPIAAVAGPSVKPEPAKAREQE